MFEFLLKKDLKKILFILFVSLICSIFQIFFPYIWGRMLETVISQEIYYFWILFFLNIFLLIASYLANIFFSNLALNFVRERKFFLRNKELDLLFSEGISNFLSEEKGYYLTRFNENIEIVAEGILAFFYIFRIIFLLIGYIIIVGYISIIFAPIVLFLTLLQFFLPYFWKKKISLWTDGQINLTEVKNADLQELFAGYLTVASAGKQSFLSDKKLKAVNYFFRGYNKFLLKKDFVKWTLLLFLFIFNNLIIISTASLAYYNYVPLLSFLTTEMYLGFIFSRGNILQEYIEKFLAARYVTKLKQSRKLSRISSFNQSSLSKLSKFKGIKLEDVSFSFAKKEIFKEINLEFLAGRKYAIIGSNGSGKSTLIRLIMSWLKPSGGKIKFNEINYEHLEWSNLRERINFVSSNFPVLRATVRKNLTIFNSFLIGDDRLKEVLRAVKLADFELDKLIDNRSISQGQRQRFALARILLLPKDILILDEALSNLDKENRHKIEDLFLKKNGQTLIYITHTLDRPELFDQVIDLARFNDV